MFDASRFPLWSSFTATPVIEGKEILGFTLTLRTSPVDDDPHVVDIQIEVPLPETADLPFTFEYVEPSEQRASPFLLVVAAPGVSIRQRRPKPQAPVRTNYGIIEPPPQVQVAIVRVQDVTLVPAMGAPIDVAGLLAPTFLIDSQIKPDPDEVLSGPNVITIQRGPRTTTFRHADTGVQLVVAVPDEDGSASAYARFAWQYEGGPRPIHLPGDRLLGGRKRLKPLLTVVATPDVTVTLHEPRFLGFGRPADEIFALFRCDRIDEVPLIGAPFDPAREGWKEERPVRVGSKEEAVFVALANTAGLIAIFSLPVVGPLLGVAEFVYGLRTGRDLMGNELSEIFIDRIDGRKIAIPDLLILGVGAIVPFIGPGVNLARQFGTRFAEASLLISMIKRAKLSGAQLQMFGELGAAIRAGKRPVKEYLEAIKLLKRFRSNPVGLEDVLDVRGRFISPPLQEEMEAELRRLGRRMSVEEWVKTTKSTRAVSILEEELGRGYQARRHSGSRFGLTLNLVLAATPESPKFAGNAGRRMIERLARVEKRLFKKMGKSFLADLRRMTRAERAAKFRIIPAWWARQMKGNIGEILAEQSQLLVLRELAAANPGKRVAIYRDVRMRRLTQRKVKKGPTFTGWAEFSDDIIAYEEGGHLHVLASLEVKSGYEAVAEGMEQFLFWEERSILPGNQIRVGEMQPLRGNAVKFGEQKTFILAPNSSNPAQLKWHPRFQRRLFHADGASPLGIHPDFGEIAKKVTPDSLGWTSAELDAAVRLVFEYLDTHGWP